MHHSAGDTIDTGVHQKMVRSAEIAEREGGQERKRGVTSALPLPSSYKSPVLYLIYLTLLVLFAGNFTRGPYGV